MNREHALLFAILAWQVGFVSRDDLVAALKAWSADRQKRLGDVLLDLGRLTGEQRDLVDRLLEQQLQLHSDDADRSLGSLPGGAALWAELEQIVAPAKGATVAGLDATLPSVSQATATPREHTSLRSPAALRFTLLRPHAHGGLGEVFVAHDEELNREVALKRIRDERLDTPENRARFVLEAEVTGGLEHPGIVPVYSLGTSDDGRPFYAMRFIKGVSLKEAIRRFHNANAAGRDESERTLELRELLSRFVDVCNAIEYAHSRGVLHRDLKPDNIMLGAYGETLVVDWGLAKPIGEPDQAVTLGPLSDADRAGPDNDAAGAESPLGTAWASGTAPTQMGSAVGTPAYMSPEQAAGQLDKVGVASDVYSLGATLYCLLTGQPPFDDESVTRLLERVRQGDPASPRTVRSEVPAPLAAICLKAMAREASDRYASPRELASELERWMADEPVVAHRAQWHERLARWGRRHRRAVEVAAAALVLVAAVSVGAFLLVHSAKQQAEHERDATRLALLAETEAKHEAHAALAAEREARLEARRALDNYVGMVIEEDVVAGEQVQPLRKRLLTDALKYYEELIDKNDDDGKVRHDLANAILRVGRIHHATGSSEEAIAAFGQALIAFQELVAKHPRESQYQRDLALCYRSLAELKSHAGDLPAAVDYFQRSLDAWQQVVELHSQASDRAELAEACGDLAQALGSSAEALHQSGRDEESRAAYRRAIEHQGRAMQLAPTNDRFREPLARLKRQLLEVTKKSGSP